MNIRNILTNDIFPLVEKPSRYLGNELNTVHKDPTTVDVRLALVFPDLYDIGLGNLGLHILYACLNKLPYVWCERAYAPALDMEAQLRERELRMFAWESKDTLDQMDGIGFTLQSELTFTNILNIIELSGIPLRTKDRGEEHPLTFAGGPAVFNPEPIAPFMDFFVMGDGEDAVVDLARVLQKLKGHTRAQKLAAISLLEGFYVPSLYPFDTLPDGQVLPKVGHAKIGKRITRDLNTATFPVDYIVPFTQQVHDRVSLEVLRGCTQGCRFCQAGMTTRPVRERNVDEVVDLMKRSLAKTGYEEVSLVSLSTCDHSQVRQLIERVAETARPDRVAVSLPSLRLDSYSVELSDMVAEQRRTGLTFAPEAASPRLRAVINKFIPDEDLLNMSAEAFSKGWNHVKLYFMIGLPTERDEDIEAIGDLVGRTMQHGRDFTKFPKVNLGVSTFVPKPFTPFQWAEQIDIDETRRRQAILDQHLPRSRDVKYGRHDPKETFLEGLVSRSDRRAADLLEAAFRKGCRFDAWSEHLNFDAWLEAIDEVGFDVAFALREREVGERLPWDHIDIYIDDSWLREDWARAQELKWAEDCRRKRCHRCGVIDTERELCASMLREHIEGRKSEADWQRKPVEPFVEPDPVQRLVFRIAREGDSRYLSHLEVMNSWLRTLRRAHAPLAYSQGFHPHPRIAFAAATPMGQASTGDYMDIVLVERVDPKKLAADLAAVVPQGFRVMGVGEVDLKNPSLMAASEGMSFELQFSHQSDDEVASAVQRVLDSPEIVIERKGKTRSKRKGGRGKFGRRAQVIRQLDIRPMLRRANVSGQRVEVEVVSVDGKPGKIREFIPLLTDRPDRVQVLKRDTMVLHEGEHRSLAEAWGIEPIA